MFSSRFKLQFSRKCGGPAIDVCIEVVASATENSVIGERSNSADWKRECSCEFREKQQKVHC
jgi:hypothetical protein